MSEQITHIVFDLGGVIIELRGAPIRREWTSANETHEQMWEKWLTANAPRQFEAGKIDTQTFGNMIVDELSLSISSAEFLDYFLSLPIAPFPGALELVRSLKPQYKTALFSNSNAMHWDKKMSEFKLGPDFDFHFASHLMGLVKPDLAAFEHVVSVLGIPAQNILFLDDNQMNVDAARSIGMLAEKVVGFEQLPSALAKHEVLPT